MKSTVGKKVDIILGKFIKFVFTKRLQIKKKAQKFNNIKNSSWWNVIKVHEFDKLVKKTRQLWSLRFLCRCLDSFMVPNTLKSTTILSPLPIPAFVSKPAYDWFEKKSLTPVDPRWKSQKSFTLTFIFG